MSTLVLALVLLCCVLAAHVGAARDYYQILGLPRDADQRQIKSRYRKLAKKYHPDKNQGNADAAARFQEVADAFETLSDEEKRRVYDQYGEEGLKANMGMGAGRPGRGAGARHQDFGGFGAGPNINFGGFTFTFGGGDGFFQDAGPSRRRQQQQQQQQFQQQQQRQARSRRQAAQTCTQTRTCGASGCSIVETCS
ncbi:DnaJ protein ERDJ3B [Porphyridium purpureum]|uniref:DnaJ protein ERDJ3B n=1 Tax=Porphyridium purpureum TaxID=35688 RepID=A0A5J4YRU5_PORPP|nr:DnaJ protein ERDJ3B [Porphyridium purpureum]|eukprot:POR9799..scf229_5